MHQFIITQAVQHRQVKFLNFLRSTEKLNMKLERTPSDIKPHTRLSQHNPHEESDPPPPKHKYGCLLLILPQG